MDLSAVYAATDKAMATLSTGRVARAAELWGRAVAEAQALQQPDCLVVAFLQCMQCSTVLATTSLEEFPPEARSKAWDTILESPLPDLLGTVKRRIAAGTLDPGFCCTYEVEFYDRFVRQHRCTTQDPADPDDQVHAARESLFLGQDVVVIAGTFLFWRLMVHFATDLHYLGADAHENCAFMVRALDTALQHSMLNHWTGDHTTLMTMAEAQLQRFAPLEGPGILLSANDRDSLFAASRRLSDHARCAHSDVLQCHQNERQDHRAQRAAILSGSAARRTCALAGCGARELHVAHFKCCAACKAVVYCCKEHQVQDWLAHKAACKAARKAAAQQPQGE